MLLDHRNSGFLDCGISAILGEGVLTFPSVLFDDISSKSEVCPKLRNNRWFNSLSTGSLPLDGSSIRMPKHTRSGSCPLPKHVLNNSGYQEDLGEINGEITHQPLFPLGYSPIESRNSEKNAPVSPIKSVTQVSSTELPWILNKKSRRRKKNRGLRKQNTDQFSLVSQRIDPGGKVVERHNEMRFGTVKSFNWKINKPHRSGVIVYTVFEDTLLFGLGIDLIYGNITDFGGQVSYTEDRNAVVGGLREYYEETHGIFGQFNPEQVKDCKVALRDDMMVMFVPLEIYPEKASIEFLKKAKLSADREIKELIWLNKKDLFKLIRRGQIGKNGHKTEIITIYKLLGNFMAQLHNTFHDFTKQL